MVEIITSEYKNKNWDFQFLFSILFQIILYHLYILILCI
jgi:hypothetical protein